MRVDDARALRPGEAAWIAAMPCALTTLAAIVWLGPALGHALPGPGSDRLWPSGVGYVVGQPEPVKHARYLLALLAPALLAAAIFAITARRAELRPARIRALVLASQALLAAFLLAAVLGQSNVLFAGATRLWPIFGARKLALAAGLVVAGLAVMRRPRVADRISRHARDTRRLRVACLVLAGAFAVLWLLTAVETDRSLGDVEGLFWNMDDSFAILSGRTPLVDYHALYAQLVPYLPAAVLWAFGKTTLVYTLLMTSLSLLTLFAVYAIYRRVVRSSLLALALFLPLLAAGFLLVQIAGAPAYSNVRLYAMWPMRYGGAYLVAWLAARHLDGAAPRRVWLLSLVAGLVVIDNLEFGVGALAGTVLALLCARSRWSRRARLLANVAVGLLAAAAIVALVTLARTGQLPRTSILLEFPRIYGVVGYVALPMPTIGLHLALYATFVAAIGVAVVRYRRGDTEPLLTGMLAWSGAFGLLAGGYFVGRSDTLKLVSLFSAWYFALGLLAVVLVRGLAARGWRRPGIPELAVLLALALAVCSFNELPMPWTQIARLRGPGPAFAYVPAAERFVAAHARPGEKVAILIGFGHRMAYEDGAVNVAPYSFIEAMVVKSQMVTLIDTMRRERAHELFLPNQFMAPPQLALLARAGFSPRISDRLFSIWSDAPARAPG
jgi:hypothetical protein